MFILKVIAKKRVHEISQALETETVKFETLISSEKKTQHR